MNGFLAALFWSSTILNPDHSLLDKIDITKSTQSHSSWGVSSVYFEDKNIGFENFFWKTEPYSVNNLKTISMISITDNKGLWFGYGLNNTISTEFFSKDFLEINLSFLPGIYIKNEEVDLGGWLMFRSGFEILFNLNENNSISVGFDHRSSGDIWPNNPGLETIFLKFNKKI